MKTLNTFTAATLFATGVLLASASAHADAGFDQYRRVVLGDTTIAAPVSATKTSANELVAGPFAQHLIYTGASKSEAIAAAARIGEQASYRTVSVDVAQQRTLTPAQAYAKYLGNDRISTHVNESVGSAE